MRVKKRLTVAVVEHITLAAPINTPLHMAQADAIVTALRENVFVVLKHNGNSYSYNPANLRATFEK